MRVLGRIANLTIDTKYKIEVIIEKTNVKNIMFSRRQLSINGNIWAKVKMSLLHNCQLV